MTEAERPGLVIFVITTDGLENSSVEFSLEQVREMIERQQADYAWQVTYRGANQDAFSAAGGVGIDPAGVANLSMDAVPASYAAASSKISRMRGQRRASQRVSNELTEEERRRMKKGGGAFAPTHPPEP